MPKLNFELPAQMDSDQTYSKIEKYLKADNSFKKFDPKLTTTFDQSKKSCTLSGSQFKAELVVKPKNDKCDVCIEVEIPFALTLFKGKIKEEIEKAFKRIIA